MPKKKDKKVTAKKTDRNRAQREDRLKAIKRIARRQRALPTKPHESKKRRAERVRPRPQDYDEHLDEDLDP